jgi:hypothetical protein
MEHAAETAFVNKLVAELAAARLSGDETHIAEAVDDLEMVVMHTRNQKLALRALSELAA